MSELSIPPGVLRVHDSGRRPPLPALGGRPPRAPSPDPDFDRLLAGSLPSARAALLARGVRVDLAEDCLAQASEKVLLAWRAGRAPRKPAEFRAYFRTAAVRSSVDEYRKWAKRRADADPEGPAAGPPPDLSSPDDRLLIRRIARDLDTLDATHRSIFTDYTVEGLTARETAERNGCTEGHVHRIRSRVLAFLREKYAGLLEP